MCKISTHFIIWNRVINSKMIFLVFMLSLLFNALNLPVVQAAQNTDGSSENLIICKHDKAVRTLRIEAKKNQLRCKAFYTKDGIDQNIGSSMKIEACFDYLKKVRVNLEKANWQCKEVKGSTASNLTETVN